MRYRFWLLLGSLALLSVAGPAPDAAAAEMPRGTIIGDSAILTVDILPLQAEVRLNGVPLGIAQDLAARTIPVVPGRHVLEVTAPGYLTSTVGVSATPDWASRVWLQLVPDRGN